MRLQLNNTGAWKNVATFDPADEAAVRGAAERIGVAAADVDAQISWRLIGDDECISAHWTHAGGWKNWARRDQAQPAELGAQT